MTTDRPFDFEAHGYKAVDEYRKVRLLYEEYAEEVKKILERSLSENWPIHSINIRAKSEESFARKACKPDEEDESQPRFKNPVEEITDLAGVRVITFFPKTLDDVNDCIKEQFDVLDSRDVGEDRFNEGRFGYRSHHHLVKISAGRIDLPEYKKFQGLTAEIQVRTILQHAWAEMEHDIQYKSVEQSPRSIQRRFAALAGMLEIADREFQAIQNLDSEFRAAVSASLQDDLTKTRLDEIAQEAGVGRVPTEKPAGYEGAVDDHERWSPTHTRSLVASGQYKAAIDSYSEKIENQPNLHTLYIGRAKARFLAGDLTGALEDVDTASRLHPEDPGITWVRRQIEDGEVRTPGGEVYPQKLVVSGNSLLAEGKGGEAFEKYSEAQALGFRFPFATFNKAMACAQIKDIDGALHFLNQLDARKGSPMEVNVLALRAIIEAMSEPASSVHLDRLIDHRAGDEEFDFGLSPLRHLEAGLKRTGFGTDVTDVLAYVFEVLRGKHESISV